MTLKTWNTIHGYFHDYDEWTFQNICKNLISYIAKLTGVSFDDMYCSLGVFLKWIVALHCESLKCWQTYLDRYHQIRIDFDEWTVQKGGMNSGHIKFFLCHQRNKNKFNDKGYQPYIFSTRSFWCSWKHFCLYSSAFKYMKAEVART